MPHARITDVARQSKPVVLLILDGWGLSPSWGGNAISVSNPPSFNYLWRNYPHAILQAFRTVAGPDGIVGSSEIGHAALGSGRMVQQDLTEINLTIENGLFFQNPVLKIAFRRARDAKRGIHFIGLLSEGGIHGSLRHAQALVECARREGIHELWIHPFTDGRDVAPTSAMGAISALERTLRRAKIGQIGTIIGRYYAMDRDCHWDRVARAYEALVGGKGLKAATARQAITNAYRSGFDDEHILPTIVTDIRHSSQKPERGSYVSGRIRPGDLVVYWNFRADRARQLTQAFLDQHVFRRFLFWRQYPLSDVEFISMTDYHLSLPRLQIAFPSAALELTLGELLANHRFRQLHVAESEKYAHVTYFFNGGREAPFEGEDRTIVPSPRSSSYDAVPAMNAGAITRIVERAIQRHAYDFIVANFANVDMVAHTGNLAATSQAVLVVDEALRRIANAVIDADGVLLITADHGNAESVADLKSNERETIHSLNPVPFLYVSRLAKKSDALARSPVIQQSMVSAMLQTERTLADIAPTILELFGIPKPSIMTGSSLFDFVE